MAVTKHVLSPSKGAPPESVFRVRCCAAFHSNTFAVWMPRTVAAAVPLALKGRHVIAQGASPGTLAAHGLEP